jgi:ribosomal RNA-processing protein 36
VASGKKPYYLKKSEQRKMELLAKYQELKSGGGLERFMEKRRKRNAAKDHRYIPSQRREGDGA